ncbi:MAG TPA: nuclear transport factor 2 family protein [Thermomicrobiales bacterium]|nr:nuclear transport factor 2 family protein [Thermomicrobiales bacterium]
MSDANGQPIPDLAQAWAKAERDGDIGFVDRTFTDDFLAVGPRGFVLTKAQWIDRIQSGDLRYESIELDDLSTRRYDDAAIVVAREQQRATYRGHDASGQFRTTLVFIRAGNAWRLASLQFSPIAPPPGAPAGQAERGGAA